MAYDFPCCSMRRKRRPVFCLPQLRLSRRPDFEASATVRSTRHLSHHEMRYLQEEGSKCTVCLADTRVGQWCF